MSEPMPEVVWVFDASFGSPFGPIWYANTEPGEGTMPYVPESRLLAAEARVREVEAERDGLARHIDRRADGMDPLTQALRAERDALVPLARAGLNAYDYVLAKEQYGKAIVPVLDRVSLDESLTQARSILAREVGA